MSDFTLTGFASLLGGMAVEMQLVEHDALEKAAVIVETEAKRVLGTHDYSWPPLAPSTIARKATGDSPLLETGELRDSIQHHVGHTGAHGGMEADIGSDNDKALWHELGTARVPPRPFLSGAAIHKEHEVVDVIGREMVAFLAGGTVRRQIV
jgi:hypothetical protein